MKSRNSLIFNVLDYIAIYDIWLPMLYVHHVDELMLGDTRRDRQTVTTWKRKGVISVPVI